MIKDKKYNGLKVARQVHDIASLIPIEIAAEAFKEYTIRYSGQDFGTLQNRGGFGVEELIRLLFARCKRLDCNEKWDLF